MLETQYCKAYELGELRQGPDWALRTKDSLLRLHLFIGEEGEGVEHEDITVRDADDSTVLFLHQDFTVTEGIYPDDNVILEDVDMEWQNYCVQSLDFEIPKELKSGLAS